MEKYIIDLVMLIIIVLAAVFAARRGFFLSLLNFCASVIALVAARVCSPGVSTWLYTSFLREPVLAKVQSFLPADLTSGDPQMILDGVVEQLPDNLVALAEKYNLLPTQVDAVDSAAAFFDINNLEASYIKPFIVTVLGFVVMAALFYVLYAVLRIFARLIDHHRGKNKNRVANRIAGAALGAVRAAIPVLVLSLVLNLAAAYASNDQLRRAVDNSKICGFVATATEKIMSSDQEA